MSDNTQETEKDLLQPVDRQKIYEEWKAGKKPLLDILRDNYKAPERKLSPEQQQKAKFGAALSDTFNTIAQMFAEGRGARIRNNSIPTSTARTNASIKQSDDKYDQEVYDRNKILANAEYKDFMDYVNAAEKEKGRQFTYYIQKAKMEEQKLRRALQELRDEKAANRADKLLEIAEYNSKKTSTSGRGTTPKGINVGNVFVNNEDINNIYAEILRQEKPIIQYNGKDPITGAPVISEKPADVNAGLETKKALLAKYPQYSEKYYGTKREPTWKKSKATNTTTSTKTSSGKLY